MKQILKLFEEYYPTYDPACKILQLKGKISVKEFVTLKRLLTYTKEEVLDIRVN